MVHWKIAGLTKRFPVSYGDGNGARAALNMNRLDDES